MKWPLGNNLADEETEEPADIEKNGLAKTKNESFAVIRVASLVCHA